MAKHNFVRDKIIDKWKHETEYTFVFCKKIPQITKDLVEMKLLAHDRKTNETLHAKCGGHLK